ncbi:MAG: proline--tRNA ligase [Candidatus Sericytochromatia bacterium]
MKYSKIYPKTRKEDPKTVVSNGTKFLIRGGFIEQVSSGIWILSTLGIAVKRKIEAIVRDEMNKSGAVEFEFPILQPKELWEESGRWDKYIEAEIAFRLKDRKNLEYFLAPTAEEVVTNFAKKHLKSYKNLPVNIWQMNQKFRDEIRPRQGLIRGREFVMKDAYSFDETEQGMAEIYEKMNNTYNKIFSRCGLNFIKVEADSGSIGGSNSAEFMALTDIGEDTLLFCPECNYGGNQEKATALFNYEPETLNDFIELPTPNIRTVEELVAFTNIPNHKMLKTVILEVDGEPVIVSIRGDLEISEIKLANLLGAKNIKNASPETVFKVTNAPVGFAGPINLYKNTTYKYFFDKSAEGLQNFLCGCNKEDIHGINVNFERDLPKPDSYHDLSKAVAGQKCSSCKNGTLKQLQGVEVGHIFQLGQVYSKPMKATFINKEGKEEFFYMGCYGIGVSRILQTIAEQFYDNNGIIWPLSTTPYQITVLPANVKVHLNDAENIYNNLKEQGFEVLLDDSDTRMGEKFINAELLGIPLQVVVGKSWEENKKVEVRWRNHNNYDQSIFSIKKEKALPSCEMDLETLFNFIKKVF